MSNSPNLRKLPKVTGRLFLLLFCILFSWFIFAGTVNAATQWVADPTSCNISDPTNFPGQNCSPDRICGDNSGIAQCYNTSSLTPPAVTAISNTLHSASYPNGGYIVNCYATIDSAAPFCDNNGAYWCNRSNTCYTTQRRDTVCSSNVWATATCGDCRSGYGDCNLDGGVCEVQFNVTAYPVGDNNVYGASCLEADARCSSGYYDCDGTGVTSGNGCEALRSGSCTTGGGLTGVWSCSVDAGGSCTNGGSNYTCTCVPPKQYFETGTKAQYGTSDPLLWGVQFGSGRLIQFGNSANEELFAVNNDGSVELATITAPATTTNKLYNVAGSLYWNGVMVGAGGGGSGTAIWDTDLDTGIQTEENVDEDMIRMDVGGMETVLIQNTVGEPLFRLAGPVGGRVSLLTNVNDEYDAFEINTADALGGFGGNINMILNPEEGFNVYYSSNISNFSLTQSAFQVGVNNHPAALYVSSNGYLGVNTQVPSTLLHVQGGLNGPAVLILDSDDGGNDGADAGIIINSDYSSGSDAAYISFRNNGVQAAKFYGASAGSGFMVDGNNPFDIVTNGSTRLFIGGDGAVGVGTATPNASAKLDIYGGDLRLSNTTGAGCVRYNNTTNQLEYSHDCSIFTAFGASAGAGGWTDDGAVVRLTTSTDRVGIANANPKSVLDIGEAMLNAPAGDISVVLGWDGGDSFFETYSTDMSEGLIMHGVAGYPSLHDYGVVRNIASNGYASTWERGLHIFSGDDGTNPDPIIFRIDGGEVMRMTDSGNVGVGHSNPSVPLQVFSSSGINTYFQVGDNSRGGVYIGNGGMLGSNEAGLYDAGADIPLAIYNAENDFVNYYNLNVNTTNNRVGINRFNFNPGAYLEVSAYSPTTTDALLRLNNGNDFVDFFAVNANPNGVITAPKGSLAIDYNNAQVYINTDELTTWSVLGGGASGDLQAVTDLGNVTSNDIEINNPSTATLSVISTGDDAFLNLIGSGGASALRMSSNGGIDYATFEIASNGSFNMLAGASNVLWADASTGNVGIGTSIPSGRLHVYGGSSNPIIAQFANIDVPNGFVIGSDLYGGEAGLYEMATGGQLLVGHHINDNNLLMLGQELAYGDQTTKNFSLNTTSLTHSLLVQGNTTTVGDNLFKVQGGVDGSYLSIYVPVGEERDTNIQWQRDLRFLPGPASSPAMVISNSSKVGVGTVGPDRLFHVETVDTASSAITYAGRFTHMVSGLATPPASGFGTGLEFELQNHSSINRVAGTIENIWAVSDDGLEDSEMILKTMVDGTLAERMRIDDQGFVGIGTSVPLSKLTLAGDNSLAAASLLRFLASNDSSIQSEIYFPLGGNATYWDVNSSGNGGALIIENYTTELAKFTNQGLIINDGSASGVDFRVESDTETHALFVDATNGYIGLDQATPAAKLHVGNTSAGLVADYNYLQLQGAGDVEHNVYIPGGSNLMIWDYNGTGNGGAIEFRNYGVRVGLFTNSGLVINEGGVTGVGLRVEGDTQTHLLYTDAANDRVGIGTNTPGLRFHVVQDSNAVAAFDRTGNDGTIISIRQDGAEEGTISVSGNTVSYNAFTGSHYTWHDGVIEKGTLVSMTGKNKRLNDNEKSEVLYGVEVTKEINSPKVLGSYLAILESQEELSTTNPALVMAVGNGEVWVADKGENIEAGDYLISSDIAGHAQKMDTDYALNYVVARAAEDIDWSDVKEKTVDGVKHKMITVFFDNLVVNTQMVNVIKSNQLLGSRLNLAKMDKKEANEIKKQLGSDIGNVPSFDFGMQFGQAIIPGKQTWVRVDFDNPYSSVPIVMLTLASDSSLMRYFVSNVTETGFNLNLYPSQYQDTLFNWQAYSASGVKNSVQSSQPMLHDLPEYEVPVVVPVNDDLEDQTINLEEAVDQVEEIIPPDPESNILNLNGSDDVLYNSAFSIVEVGDGLGEEIANNEDSSAEVPVMENVEEAVLEEITETPSTPEITETPATSEITEAPVTPEVIETSVDSEIVEMPVENLE